jgi:hypothetical protein
MRAARVLLVVMTMAFALPAAAVAGQKPGAPPPWVNRAGTVHATTQGSKFVSYRNSARCTFHPPHFIHSRSLPYTCSGHQHLWYGAAATYRIFVGRATRVFVTERLSDLEGNTWDWPASAVRHGRYLTVTAAAGYNSGAIRGIHVALRWD